VQLIQQAPVQASLKSLAGLYIDCGAQDQYRLVFGARQLRDQMQQAGIEHHYAEFDDDHSSVDYRMDISLPYLYSKIKA
jgi:enterochelin esterase-like enzyme